MSVVNVEHPCPHCRRKIRMVVRVDESEGYGETRGKCPHCKKPVTARHTRGWRRSVS